MGGNPSQPLESSGFPEDVQVLPGDGSTGDMQVAAVEGKGEVKRGGEDGGSNSGAPHREKRAGESEEFSNIRRGRGMWYLCFVLTAVIRELMKWGGSR